MAQTESPIPPSASPLPASVAVETPPPIPNPASPSPIAPGICELVAAVLLLTLALAPNSLLNGDGDTAQHVALGRIILAQGAAPQIDLFSHAHAGQPFLDWEWLAEAIFAAINAALGLNGVAILAATLIAGTLYVLCRWMMAQGLHPLPALVVGLLAAVASEIHWLARPHLFTFLFLLLTLVILECVRLGRMPARRLALIPPLLLLWANLHPMFVFGLVMCAVYAGGALLAWGLGVGGWGLGVRDERGAGTTAATGPQVRAYCLTLVVGALATLVNPYGLGLWEHIVTYSGGSFTTGLIAEFQPPNFRQPITWGFLLLLAGALVVLARTWRRVPLIHLLLLAGWTALAFQAARNILPFSVLVPALLAPQLAYLLNRAPRPGPAPFWVRYRVVGPIRQGFPWLLAGTLAGLLALAALGGRVGGVGVLHAAWTEPPFPIRAVHFLQATPPAGKMFNDITWGGYLLDALYPRRQVFISSQQDAYGDALNRAYLTAEFTLPGWEQVLADYDIGWVIDTPGSRLVQALRARPERWQVLYADTTAVVLTRR